MDYQTRQDPAGARAPARSSAARLSGIAALLAGVERAVARPALQFHAPSAVGTTASDRGLGERAVGCRLRRAHVQALPAASAGVFGDVYRFSPHVYQVSRHPTVHPTIGVK